MRHSFPLVTILMPCKEVKASFLREALASVFSQSDPLWNLIVIYDVSDNTETTGVLKELKAIKDDRVSVLKNEACLLTGALNTGMRRAKTPFVCSLLCDDLLDEKAVEVLTSYITDYPDVHYFHSSRMRIDENGKPISGIHMAKESFDLSDFKNLGPVKHMHAWKVESALAIGGMDESLGLHGADDYDFPWCMAEAGYKFKAMPECLYYYRDHREHYRLTTHVPLETQINELKKIWRKHGLTDEEMEEQIRIRTAGYLRQAMYLNDQDKKNKEDNCYDIRKS